jgi:hypothetical protein
LRLTAAIGQGGHSILPAQPDFANCTFCRVRLGLTISGNQTIAAIAAMPGSDQ